MRHQRHKLLHLPAAVITSLSRLRHHFEDKASRSYNRYRYVTTRVAVTRRVNISRKYQIAKSNYKRYRVVLDIAVECPDLNASHDVDGGMRSWIGFQPQAMALKDTN
jgi:hypothetical protein